MCSSVLWTIEQKMPFSWISTLIVSVTKFSIMIGSPRAYLSCNRCDHVGFRLQVSDLNFFKSDTCNWIPRWFSHFALIRFWNYSCDYSLNCTPLGPSTITNYWDHGVQSNKKTRGGWGNRTKMLQYNPCSLFWGPVVCVAYIGKPFLTL